MARKHIAEMTPAEAAAQREKWRVQKRAQRQRARQERQTTTPDAWQAAEREAEEMRSRAQEEMERARRERKAAERRAKHAAAERARRARLKSLTPQERQLLALARKWGLTAINSTNIKQFKAYLDMRTAQHIASFTYDELADVSKDYDALLKVRKDPAVIMADFAEYQLDVINAVEQVRGALSERSSAKYSASLFESEWARYVEDVKDEMRYNDRQNKRKRG